MIFVIGAWALALLIWLGAIFRRFGSRDLDIPFTLLGFLIIFCGSVLGYDLYHIPAPIPITSDRALLGLFVVLFGILLVRRKITLRSIISLDVLMIALLAVIVGSTVTHDFSISGNLPISRFIFFYLMPFMLYFVSKNAVHKDWEIKYLLLGFSALGCYLAITGIFEVLELRALVFPRYIMDASQTEFLGRARGPFLNPISNGIFMTTALCSAVVLFWQCNNFKHRVLLAPVIALICIGNVATLTRSVWMAMTLGVGVVVWVITDRKQKAIVIVGGTIAAVALVASLGGSLINFKRDKHVTANEMSKSAELRPIFATIALEMFKDRPVFGHGFGQYNNSKSPYLTTPNTGLQLALAKPYLQHNVFLSLLTELGLIGAGLLIALLLTGFWISVALFRHATATPQTKSIGLVLFAMLTSYVVNGMFHDTSIIPMANLLLFFLLGIGARIHQEMGLATNLIQLERRVNAIAANSLDYAG